jgi:hypothetical protein
MQAIMRRLSSLTHLTRPLVLTFIGVVLLSLGVGFLLLWAYQETPTLGIYYVLTLQFIPNPLRGIMLIVLGLIALVYGIWSLSGVVIVSLPDQRVQGREMVVGYRADRPRIVVVSGGAGMLVLANLSRNAEQLTCLTPLQEPIEYYYRASSLFQAHNVDYVVPTPTSPRVYAELDNGTTINVMHVDHHLELAERHVKALSLQRDGNIPESGMPGNGDGQDSPAQQTKAPPVNTLPLTRPAADAIRNADAIVLGPGSLFESVLPNFLMDDFRKAVQESKARKIYICNLMTEPGLTTGFSVSDHIRHVKKYTGFAPDYVLVNVQRIETEVQQIYASAHQAPVYVTPEEHEETAVPKAEYATEQQLMLEDSVVIEADLASSVIQYKASVTNPSESRAVRVLRHDPEKLALAILEVLKRE